jgi:hypothetical protein
MQVATRPFAKVFDPHQQRYPAQQTLTAYHFKPFDDPTAPEA